MFRRLTASTVSLAVSRTLTGEASGPGRRNKSARPTGHSLTDEPAGRAFCILHPNSLSFVDLALSFIGATDGLPGQDDKRLGASVTAPSPGIAASPLKQDSKREITNEAHGHNKFVGQLTGSTAETI